jgi:hypothetical protein
MVAEVVALDDRRPHLSVVTPGAVHVVPVSAVKRFAEGALPLDALPEAVIRALVGDALVQLMGMPLRRPWLDDPQK